MTIPGETPMLEEQPGIPDVHEQLRSVTEERDAQAAILTRVAALSREMVSRNRHPQHGPAEFGSRLKGILAADGEEILARRDALVAAEAVLEASADLLNEMEPSKKTSLHSAWLDERGRELRSRALR